jgi:hypothetical protein
MTSLRADFTKVLLRYFSDENLIGVPIPLSKEGQPRSAGVVCSKLRSILIDAREAHLINRYCSPLNRPPQPLLRKGIPALLRRGICYPKKIRSSIKPESTCND